MDIKDAYLHGAIGVVKSINVNADKLIYTLADQANTPKEVTLPTVTTTANGLTPKIVKNNNPISNFNNDWVLTSTSGNTPVWKQLPYSAFNGLGIAGTFNLAKANASDITNIQNQLSGNQMRWYLISDSNGNLPSSSETTITVTNSLVKLLFGTIDNFGASVGDLMIVTKTICKVLPLNDAKAPSGSFPGAIGLESPWDKTQINKIPLIESPSRTESNMNNALDSGVYPWCTLGRPANSTGAYTCIVNKSTTADNNGYYTIEQTAYGRERELGQVYKRVIFWKNSNTVEYTDWVRVDTIRNVVSSYADGLAPKVIANTLALTTSYYVLASSNGSNTPSWYKLPATAFSNDDTKVTLTDTTNNNTYRVLFSSTADDTTRTEGARKSTNLKFNPSTGTLTSVIFNGGLYSYASTITDAYKSGKVLAWFPHINHVNNFAGGESGFPATSNANGVLWLGTHANGNDASALGHGHQLGFSSNKRIYHRAFYTNIPDTANGGSWYKIAYTSDNFPSNQIDKLTGYTKPTTALSALNDSDTLNQALGKLELKADLGITVYNWYLSITEEDTDTLVNKWGEIVDFLNSVEEGTDITDEFVTRKTNLTITGVKRFTNSLYTLNNIYGNDDKEIIHADNDYFELGKGYSDVTTWFNGKEYKFNVGNTTQAFIISKEGNVGIGDVGGAPAYKLHVGGGEVMADSYTAWSGGFVKNGSSNSYVLLGGGGHKAISDFATASGVVTSLGTNGNYVTWTKNGTTNNLTVPYATKATKLINKSYDKSSDIDWTHIFWTASGTDTDNIIGMSYAAVMNVGTDLFRGWQIWNNRNDHKLYWRPAKADGSTWADVHTLLDNTNTHITDGVITINGVSITPLTEHQSLSNYVTLTTTQTISGSKTFTSTLITGSITPESNNTYDLGTNTNAWKLIYGTVTNVSGVAATANAARHVWFSDSVSESKRNYDDDFVYNPSNNLLTVGSITGSAAQLTSTNIVSDKKFTNLTSSSWTDTDYTFTNLESGTYAILVTSNNLVASGIMSVYTYIEDSVGDEIPLHVYGTAGWRPYLRTHNNKLLISSNDVTEAADGRTVTIKIAKIL